MSAIRRFIPHKEIGWEHIGEKFTRYSLLKTPALNSARLESPADEIANVAKGNA